ncbi:aldose 1-epimerase [Ensifer adhaerens]|uniref:Aldose 1-epimerase n=1 Tax=Ensifer adhaerens TaxID=106592 RepID=A0A9Q9DDG1_ENSAD|nr:aldose 1-epimerase [Ensifer adhaerens]USJ27698.1 aldose 1-epimerase [Ensifer adhaerens]
MPDLTINSGALSASFRPDLGGRLTRLTHRDYGDVIVPLTDVDFDPLNWPKAGAFPLFPFHGRLADASFEHGGRCLQLQPNPNRGTDAMHGPAHRRPWDVLKSTLDETVLTLNYKADPEWPFEFRAVQRFRICGSRMDIEFELTNQAGTAVPAGLGWHPYFISSLNNPIRCNATMRRKSSASTDPKDSWERRPLPVEPLSSYPFTEHLSDWSETSIASGRGKVEITRHEGFPFVVIHRTPNYTCVEPVSHEAGALGLPELAREGAGLATLRPLSTAIGRISISVNSNQSH